jgi:hypothetical protein
MQQLAKTQNTARIALRNGMFAVCNLDDSSLNSLRLLWFFSFFGTGGLA